MYKYCFTIALFFTISKAILCPYRYKDDLCNELIEIEETYCNPENGLCELNETEFENLLIDIEKIYKDSVCSYITNNNNSNKDVEIALISITVVLFIIVVIMSCILTRICYMYIRKKKYDNDRKELENVYYINKTDNESEDLKTVSLSGSETDFENDEDDKIKSIIF